MWKCLSRCITNFMHPANHILILRSHTPMCSELKVNPHFMQSQVRLMWNNSRSYANDYCSFFENWIVFSKALSSLYFWECLVSWPLRFDTGNSKLYSCILKIFKSLQLRDLRIEFQRSSQLTFEWYCSILCYLSVVLCIVIITCTTLSILRVTKILRVWQSTKKIFPNMRENT